MPNADYMITIELVDGKHAMPKNIPKKMLVGRTVNYSSPAGEVTVQFPSGWPFTGQPHEVHSSDVLKLEIEGTFPCRCFIKLPNNGIVGWDKESSPQSGGDNRVGH